MTKEINTRILINATPRKIWDVLTDFSNYPQWNPFIRAINGDVARGNYISVDLQLPGAGKITMKPKILAFDVNEEIRWIGHLFIPGIFDGEHAFEIFDQGDGTSVFVQKEKFKGFLVPVFKKMIEGKTTQGFNLMNHKLKEMAEKNGEL